MSQERAFLIDGNSFCYRAFYAIRTLSTSTGRPTNAVYGFVTMLQKLTEEEHPDYLGVSFDLKGPTLRHARYSAYKIHRKPMPDELSAQFPTIKEILRRYRIPIYEKEGFEADDILATLARRLAKKGIAVYLVTGDKDILQMVNDSIFVYNPQKETVIYDRNKVLERYGVGPEKMVEIMALSGDTTDNIPGVPGIGEKSAVELIQQFGTLEKVLSHLDQVKSESRRKSLEQYAEQARLSRELAQVDCEVPIEVDLKELRVKEPDGEGLYQIFKELEFKSLLIAWAPTESIQRSDRVITDRKELEELARVLRKVRRFAFGFERFTKDPLGMPPHGLALCWEKGKAVFIPFSDSLSADGILRELRPILEDPNIEKVGQDLKSSFLLLAKSGVQLKGASLDTMIAAYLLNPSKPSPSLEELSLEFLDRRKKDLAGPLASVEERREVCGEETALILELSGHLEKELRKKELLDLFQQIELPLLPVLAQMEATGVAIDVPFLRQMSQEMEKELSKLTRDIYEMAEAEFNIQSPKQLREIFYQKLKLPVLKRTKTGPSTDVWVLERLALIHPLPKAIVSFRELAKLKSTYVDALPEMVHPQTKRVHTSFNQAVTATGRLSSSNPNLQNIPIRTEVGRRIRRAFIPSRSGGWLVSFDYSQIELRILAHLSGDVTLKEAFRQGHDIHRITAGLIHRVPEEAVTAEMRDMAKTVNFGIIYGMSAFGLSRDLGIEVGQAQDFIDAYFGRYPGVKSYFEKELAHARGRGYVTTLFGRRRYIPEIQSKNGSERQLGERLALNAPIQGTASDLIKQAMIAIHQELVKRSAKTQMVIQIHDELLFDMPDEEGGSVVPMITEKMEHAATLSVPIKVTVKRGKNWLEMTEVK